MPSTTLTGTIPPQIEIAALEMLVRDDTNPSVYHRVVFADCDCPDMQFRNDPDRIHWCKHIRAVYETLRDVQLDDAFHGVVRITSFTDPAKHYTVRLAWCPCGHMRSLNPGDDWCNHLLHAYRWHGTRTYPTSSGALSAA